jgi:uncharacterized membrane protein
MTAWSLLLRTIRFFDGQPVEGGPILNTLVLGYLVPALLASILAYLARPVRPFWYCYSACKNDPLSWGIGVQK